MHHKAVTKMLLGLFLIICNLDGALLAQSSSSAARASSGSDASGQVAAADLGIVFVNGSSSEIILERNGKRYLVDVATHAIREANPGGATAGMDPANQSSSPAGPPP